MPFPEKTTTITSPYDIRTSTFIRTAVAHTMSSLHASELQRAGMPQHQGIPLCAPPQRLCPEELTGASRDEFWQDDEASWREAKTDRRRSRRLAFLVGGWFPLVDGDGGAMLNRGRCRSMRNSEAERCLAERCVEFCRSVWHVQCAVCSLKSGQCSVQPSAPSWQRAMRRAVFTVHILHLATCGVQQSMSSVRREFCAARSVVYGSVVKCRAGLVLCKMWYIAQCRVC